MNYIKHHFHIIPAIIILAFAAVYSHFVFAAPSVPSIVQNETNFQATDPRDGVTFTFPGTFKDDATSGYYLDIQKTETGSDPLSNGKYSAQAALGVYGTTAKMADADDYIDQNIILKIKKKGSSSYIGALELDTENNTSFSNGDLINAGYSSWDNNFTVDPGEYTVDLILNGGVGDSLDICLPSFDPIGSVQPIGNVTCTNPTAQGGNSNPAAQGSNPAQGGNSNSYTLTIGDPIFVKGANNNLAQFNVPLKYVLPAKPTDKSKVTGTLQTVIYKKNELKKVEAVASLDSQNITYNTASMYGYQWSGLVSGNEYVVYLYDQSTEVKSAYMSLKYGSTGNIIAAKISALPSWTANTTVSAQGGNNSPTQAGGGVATGQQSSTGITVSGITPIFKASPEFIPATGADSIRVNGFVRYEYYGTTEPSLKANRAGESISVSLYDKAGNNIPGVGKVIPITSAAYNKDIPLDIVLLATQTDHKGVTSTAFTAADGPFKIKMSDPGLQSGSGFLTVKTGSGSPVNTNQASNPQTSNGIAADGSTVVFKMENVLMTTTTDKDGKEVSKIDFKGTITYEKAISSPTIKVNKLAGELYDDAGTKLRTMNVVFNSVTPTTLGISGTFSNIDTTSSPAALKIWDKDSHAVSDGFTIDQSGGSEQILMNGANVPQTEAVLGKDGVNSVVFTIDPEYSNGKVSGTLKIEYKTKKPGTADSNISGGDVSVTLYNKSGAALKTINLGPVASGLVVFDQQSVPASFDFPSLNASDAPFTVKATEKSLDATSKAFSVPDAKVGGNNDDPDAEDDGEGTPPPSDNAKRTYLFNPLREGLDTIPKIVSALVKDIVIPIALPALALAIIWTGFLFVMARGNETKLTEAKRALKWTVIGGLIILGAYVIATALQQTLKDIVQ